MAVRSGFLAGILLAATALAHGGDGREIRPEAVVLVPATAKRVLDEARRPGRGATLVNIWATWCQPCREEFPDLLRVARKYSDRGLRLLLVSADFDTEAPDVRRFLAASGVSFPTYLKDEPDQAFIDGIDPRWSGALPATFVYDSFGKLRRFWEGKADFPTLERRVLDVLGESGGASRGPGEVSK